MDATPQTIERHSSRTDTAELDRQPFEVRLYQASPLGFGLTTLAIFVLIYGFYVAVAQLSGRPPVFETAAEGGVLMTRVAWTAFVLSLIFTGGIAFTEAGRRMWEAEMPRLLAALDAQGETPARALAGGIPPDWQRRHLLMTCIGAVAGLGFNGVVAAANSYSLATYLTSVGLWFVIVSPLLYAIGFRAGVDVVRESGAVKALIRENLTVDLFHLDRLSVFSRVGLRAARSWLVMAAILLLFLINPNHPDRLFDPAQLWVTVPTVLASVLGGLFLLASALHPVHVKIRAAKQAELDRIHAEMAKMRDKALAGDTDAASTLAGYTDYEIWVNGRPEWPVSAGLSTRFSLYVLIPVIPIIGSYVFEKLADQFMAGGGM